MGFFFVRDRAILCIPDSNREAGIKGSLLFPPATCREELEERDFYRSLGRELGVKIAKAGNVARHAGESADPPYIAGSQE